ncbi:MAG: septum formation protein Maf [Clostridia bacterium]|nr:septum formation protein Maf [Clostridia bacterium]
MTKLILASASPRRREILSSLGVAFSICPSLAEERSSESEPALLVEDLARQKGRAVYTELKQSGRMTGDTLILSCDTVVALGNEILGKPKDLADAKRMLRLLSGKEHVVASGVCLTGPDGKQYVTHEETFVRFFDLTDDRIKAYLAAEKVTDKAGAYAIQGKASSFVKSIRGDYLNVVGLPLFALFDLYRKNFGKNFLSALEKEPVL